MEEVLDIQKESINRMKDQKQTVGLHGITDRIIV